MEGTNPGQINPAIYNTNELIQVIPSLFTAQTWLLDNFFPYERMADTELLSIDVEIGKRRIAPFVSPLVEGKLVESMPMRTLTFMPPYIKDKRLPNLLKPVRRMIGERIGGGEETADERAMQNMNREMTEQIEMINRRMEWMAAQFLQTGTVTVAGDGFPTSVIDFGRDSSLTASLSGSAMWDSGSGTTTPSANIDNFATAMLKKSGAVSTDIIFTPTPWQYFIKDPTVFATVIQDVGRFTNPNQNNLQFAVQNEIGALYKGNWGGYRLWLYNDWFVNDSDTEVRMINDGNIIMASRTQLMGTRAFGMIKDPRFNYKSMAYAPKAWITEDPAQLNLMMQSAPLTIPGRPNASMCLTVTNPVVP
jgi:hypothetical protein